MTNALDKVIAALLLASGMSACVDRAQEVQFASYEDCILGKLGRGQSKVASEAIIAACKSKFGKVELKVDSTDKENLIPCSKRPSLEENPYADLIPCRPENRPENEVADSSHLNDGKDASPAAGPWEKFQRNESAEEGPWAKFSASAEPTMAAPGTPAPSYSPEFVQAGVRPAPSRSGLWDDFDHKAGWEWAKKNRITDPDGCDGRPKSFVEGCKAYVEGHPR